MTLREILKFKIQVLCFKNLKIYISKIVQILKTN